MKVALGGLKGGDSMGRLRFGSRGSNLRNGGFSVDGKVSTVSIIVPVVVKHTQMERERDDQTYIDTSPTNHPHTTSQPPVLCGRYLLLRLGGEEGGTARGEVANDRRARAARFQRCHRSF